MVAILEMKTHLRVLVLLVCLLLMFALAWCVSGRQGPALAEGLPPWRHYLPFVARPHEPCPPLDGLWVGETVTTASPDKTRGITFTVSHNGTAIASGAEIGLYYSVRSGMWICSGGRMTLNWQVPVQDDCRFFTSGGLLHKAKWSGVFTSARNAEGTFEVTVFTTMCGNVTRTGTWRARFQSPAP
jgi:hypothetical protein